MILYKGLDIPPPDGGRGRTCIWYDTTKPPPPYYLPDLTGNGRGLNWGQFEVAGRKLPRDGCDALALALCAAILDEEAARKAHKLFQFRHVNTLPDGRWTFTHERLRALVMQLLQDMGENERMIARAPRDRVEFQRETGVGANGVPVRWDTDDDGKIIPARDPDDMTWTAAPHRRGT
jgi:hypothetical protein